MANTTTTKTVTWTHGVNCIRAGTPLDTNGRPVMDQTAVGIVAEDLHAPDRTATVITAGEWDESVNAPYFHISDVVKKALDDITFSDPPVPTTSELFEYFEEELEGYATKEELEGYATKEELEGYVTKTGEQVEDLADDPGMADFNDLLNVLRQSGIIDEAQEDEAQEDEP